MVVSIMRSIPPYTYMLAQRVPRMDLACHLTAVVMVDGEKVIIAAVVVEQRMLVLYSIRGVMDGAAMLLCIHVLL